ncbi:MAG: lipid-A-disaccharide synthase [Burkholderiales bacterium]
MRIGIVAGEASGDLLGSHLVRALKEKLPEVEFVGIGGPKMQSAGVTSLFPMEKLAVMGYVEVLKRYFQIVAIRRKLIRYFKSNPPDIFVGVDAPDFNLDLERSLKRAGIPTIHYVSPSIWAWRGERIHKIRKSCTKVLALFPFEKELYDKAGIDADYVGHPLADMIPESADRAAMRRNMKLPPDAKIFAFLPGSRQSELQYMADTFIQTAMLVREKWPDAKFLVPLASRETRTLFEEAIYRNHAEDIAFTLFFGHAVDAMMASDIVLVASGTATLEAALLKRPMVITYKMAPLTYSLKKRKKYQPYVGLPNILSGKFVVPELLQDEATPENLARALINLMQDEAVIRKLEDVFAEMQHSLKQNTAEKASLAILPLLA